jgi:sterol desaturase/sphingolipid hydroxylase (fatty acid hydroxylase superfamily)
MTTVLATPSLDVPSPDAPSPDAPSPDAPSPDAPSPDAAGSSRRTAVLVGVLGVVILLAGILLRGRAVVGIGLLFLVFVPLEKATALRRQKVFRRGWLTDVTHILVNNTVSTIVGVGIAIVMAIPLLWLRPLDLEGELPTAASIALAAVIVLLGSYWGHRLSHTVPFLWRFHAVHHSIEEMDWLAAGRLHPFDQAFTQACFLAPLIVLGYGAGVFGGAAVFLTALAIFQHANTRLRFPGIRWVINTPQWHHWHHSSHEEARDKNFGLPVVDKIFGTAYLPKRTYATEFGISDPVPEASYVRQMAYPFTNAARVTPT